MKSLDKKPDTIIVVEGEIDQLSMVEAGFSNVLSPFRTAPMSASRARSLTAFRQRSGNCPRPGGWSSPPTTTGRSGYGR